jgi:hypothetical protein
MGRPPVGNNLSLGCAGLISGSEFRVVCRPSASYPTSVCPRHAGPYRPPATPAHTTPSLPRSLSPVVPESLSPEVPGFYVSAPLTPPPPNHPPQDPYVYRQDHPTLRNPPPKSCSSRLASTDAHPTSAPPSPPSRSADQTAAAYLPLSPLLSAPSLPPPASSESSRFPASPQSPSTSGTRPAPRCFPPSAAPPPSATGPLRTPSPSYSASSLRCLAGSLTRCPAPSSFSSITLTSAIAPPLTPLSSRLPR